MSFGRVVTCGLHFVFLNELDRGRVGRTTAPRIRDAVQLELNAPCLGAVHRRLGGGSIKWPRKGDIAAKRDAGCKELEHEGVTVKQRKILDPLVVDDGAEGTTGG